MNKILNNINIYDSNRQILLYLVNTHVHFKLCKIKTNLMM